MRLIASHPAGNIASRPIFVLGCQRSGTKMLLRTFDRSPDTWTYPEYNRRAFDEDFRIRSIEQWKRLIRSSRAPFVVFKPICDSHQADEILSTFKEHGPRATWIYRGFEDVINSAVNKWDNHFATTMEAIASGRTDEVGWRGERLGPQRVNEIERLARDGMSAEAGAALFWYLRNRFYFDLKLHADPRVLLVNYERLVSSPAAYLRSVFEFAGIGFEEVWAEGIRNTAVRRQPAPTLSPEIRELCETLWHDLEAHHEARWNGSYTDREG